MVVTRRTPVVPPPPLVRNHSSQGEQRPPRTSFPKNTAGTSNDAGTSAVAASPVGFSNSNKDQRNGLDSNSEKKLKKPRRRGKKYYQKSNFQAFLDFLTKLLLLAFTVYTFSVCPQDTHLQSPICRGLAEYKRIVLDPYIIPPIQAMYLHPSVAPHIERAKPYVHRAVEITIPILLRTQQQWNLHVAPQWEKRIVPEWKKRVVPQWDKHVAPRIQRVRSILEPYLLQVMRNYEQGVAPRVQVAVHNLQRWQRQVEPYVLLAASKTKDGYHMARPYVVPLAKRAGHLFQQSTLFFREQRQQFVDPHVAKIWEKVKELSRGKQVIRETTLERESLSSDTLFVVLGTQGYETTVPSTHSPIFAYDAIPTPKETEIPHIASSLRVAEMTEAAPHSIFTEPSLSPIPEPATSMQLAGATMGSESLSDESEPAVSATPAPIDEHDIATPSVLVAATAEEPVESPASATASKLSILAASATVPPVNSRIDDEIDFEAFYAELGLEEPLGNLQDSETYHAGPPSSPTETEEERAERLRLKAEETARKRADIEARQAKWEAELQAQMEHSTLQLQSRLSELRTATAAQLTSSTDVRNSIEELVSETEKYLKGAEVYLKNLKGENRKSDEKLALWDRVADRVNVKFNERLLITEGIINAWYQIILDKELREVATATAEVREVAEKGQLDLGLDYAWLEDVTFNDWQRYHALIGVSERYADEAASVRDGGHPRIMVANPMVPIFEDLESEVRDIVIGFETRLRRIKRDGERAFNNQGNGLAQKEEEKGSSIEPEGESVPEVSILPVPRDGVEESQGFILPIIIGRNQEEVSEALGKVELVDEVDHSASPSDINPEEAVSRLVQEVEGGTEIHHTEFS